MIQAITSTTYGGGNVTPSAEPVDTAVQVQAQTVSVAPVVEAAVAPSGSCCGNGGGNVTVTTAPAPAASAPAQEPGAASLTDWRTLLNSALPWIALAALVLATAALARKGK